MTPIIATMLVRCSTNGKQLVQLERTPQATLSQSDVTLQKPSLSTLNSLGNLQDLDLESDTSNWPNSRPIGQHAKARSSSNMVTLIRGADLEGEGGGEFMLMAMRVKLQPGENRILVVGEVHVYTAHTLPFMYTLVVLRHTHHTHNNCTCSVAPHSPHSQQLYL